MEVYSHFNLPPKVVTEGGGELVTKQGHKKECDINNIMKKYYKTGVMSHISRHEGWYGSVPALDYRQALEVIDQADGVFAELPAALRKRFGNDPSEFLAFVEDESNIDEMVELGLAEPLEVPEGDPGQAEPEIVPEGGSEEPGGDN